MYGKSDHGHGVEHDQKKSALSDPDTWARMAALAGAVGLWGVFLVGAGDYVDATALVTLIALIASLGAAVLGVASAIRHKSSIMFPVMALLGGVSILLMFAVELGRFRRHPCPSHLRQIGQALMLYAHDNGGRSPDTLHELTTIVAHEVLVCPDDDDAGDGSTKVTYVYLKPKRPIMKILADEVLAYEPLEVHKTGANVLCGDGHVEWIHAPAFDRVLEEARAVTRRLDDEAATRPTTQPVSMR
jgi:prepilin-type processing-associated H-X9-DG protein